MVRIAIQSAVNFAESPGRAIRHVAEVMSHQLRDQFLTAACLYLDLNAFRARYSAAGHPPVLYRNALRQQWEPIESNGLLISRMGTDTYPEAEIEIHSGDRFLLYSDGLTEAENKAGEQFGDKRLLQVLDDASDKSCGEMSSDLHKALAEWLNNSAEQQDDYTWILIDII
jgi:serine phosphatase RsbU (regulator of sigma subunit)